MCREPVCDDVGSSLPASQLGLKSSPTLLPLDPSSDLPTVHAKRKLEVDSGPVTPKRPKRIGPFMDDEDERDGFLYVDFQRDAITQNMETDMPSLRDDSSAKSFYHAPSPGLHQTTLYNNQNFKLQRAASHHLGQALSIRSCSGKIANVQRRAVAPQIFYERIIAERSTSAPGR